MAKDSSNYDDGKSAEQELAQEARELDESHQSETGDGQQDE